MVLSLKMGTEISWIFKKLDDKVPKNKLVSVNSYHALFYLLDFMTLEAGMFRLS
jgi:hypothetical protein